VDLNDSFTLPLPIDRAWKLLTDLERIAPCLPGAQLTEIEGESHRGNVKVKVGPITAQFGGVARFTEKDEAAHRAVISAEGREQRGQGNANALVTAQLTAVDGVDGPGTATTVDVVTDLTISGKVAQFGRGVIADVSSKLISQFVSNIEKMLTEDPSVVADASANGSAPAADAPAPASDAAPSDAPDTSEAAVAEGAGTPSEALPSDAPAADEPGLAQPTIRKINAPEARPVDLLELTGGSMAKRLAPLAAGAAILVALLVLFRRRKH
jgi:carbon monoxide dehydrogenase subunit G